MKYGESWKSTKILFPRYENFTDSHVAFIDILGFGQRVKSINSQESFHEIAKLLYATRHVSDEYNKAEGILKDFRFTAISDSIIVSAPYKDPICTVGLIHVLQEIQYELLVSGFKTLSRGFLDRGHIHNKDGFLFGDGYINAYLGEQNIGGAPRIVVSPEIIMDAEAAIGRTKSKEGVITIFDFLKEDSSDGYYFIDFLKPVGFLSEKNEEELLQDRAEIKRIIESSLVAYKNQQRIRAKYKWLQTYFNETEQYY